MNAGKNLRLGVNIDHVATVRNARGSSYPDPVRAALISQEAGADGITAHLREDRRHIVDQDIASIIEAINIPLNFEMAATDEMQKIALKHTPHAVCIVPEKREERTTEGGLDVVKDEYNLAQYITEKQIRAASRIGAQVVELHTGAYCDLHYEKKFEERNSELSRLKEMASLAHSLGLEVHAGHGLTFETVSPIAELPEVVELNIGHFLIGESIFLGLREAIIKMRELMDKARL
ncbi:MAG: pyridoxine 5'-phosphate synthase [Rhodobacterales bacterium]|nr:pyridoxine 5'-phosphate synthase [Rhodobacterales bacterium]